MVQFPRQQGAPCKSALTVDDEEANAVFQKKGLTIWKNEEARLSRLLQDYSSGIAL